MKRMASTGGGRRRVIRRFWRQMKELFHIYRISATALLLIALILLGMLLLRVLGYQIPGRTAIFLLIFLLFLSVIAMVGGVWGMIQISLGGDEHVEKFFTEQYRAASQDQLPGVAPRFHLVFLPAAYHMKADVVFLLAAAVLWLGGSVLVQSFLDRYIPPPLDSTPLALLLVWFPAVRIVRLIQAVYRRLVCFRPRRVKKEGGESPWKDPAA